MGRTLVAALIFLVILSLVSSVITVAADKEIMINGTITKVDIPSNKLTVETLEGNQHTYSIDSQTKITFHGKPSALPDLKIGQNVTVETNGGRAVFIMG
jgi:hypothetical protein